MATTAQTIIDVTYTYENDRSVAKTIEPLNTRNDSKVEYANGTGSTKIERVHSSRRTLTAASGTEDIDLTTLTDPSGTTINFTSVKAIYIKNRDTNSGQDLVIGAASLRPWLAIFGSATDTMTIGPTGEWFLSSSVDGFTVTTASRVLRVTHSGSSSGDIVFDLIVIGND